MEVWSVWPATFKYQTRNFSADFFWKSELELNLNTTSCELRIISGHFWRVTFGALFSDIGSKSTGTQNSTIAHLQPFWMTPDQEIVNNFGKIHCLRDFGTMVLRTHTRTRPATFSWASIYFQCPSLCSQVKFQNFRRKLDMFFENFRQSRHLMLKVGFLKHPDTSGD